VMSVEPPVPDVVVTTTGARSIGGKALRGTTVGSKVPTYANPLPLGLTTPGVGSTARASAS